MVVNEKLNKIVWLTETRKKKKKKTAEKRKNFFFYVLYIVYFKNQLRL